MPLYRGASQADLICSINDGLDLLEKYPPGPECQKYINDLRAPDAAGQSKLDVIAAAQDDVALAEAVQASRVKWLLNRAYDIFEFHALANTDKKGFKVFKGLISTGLVGDIMTLEKNKFDLEFESFLKKHFIRNAFNKVCLVTKARKFAKLQSLAPIQNYGLVLFTTSERKAAFASMDSDQASKKVKTILDPLMRLGEVRMIGIGPINPGNKPKDDDALGVVFTSTRRAAQAVAAGFPGMEVLDCEGKIVVPPQAKPQPPNAQPKP